jgi:hypothetical protein
VSPPHDWDPVTVVAACPAGPWRGEPWRGHNRNVAATSFEGSRRFSGRDHRAPDCFPSGPTWTALYLALTEATTLLEIARQYDARDWPPKNRRFTKLRVELQMVIDCSDPTCLPLSFDDLCRGPDDLDRDPCHTVVW